MAKVICWRLDLGGRAILADGIQAARRLNARRSGTAWNANLCGRAASRRHDVTGLGGRYTRHDCRTRNPFHPPIQHVWSKTLIPICLGFPIIKKSEKTAGKDKVDSISFSRWMYCLPYLLNTKIPSSRKGNEDISPGMRKYRGIASDHANRIKAPGTSGTVGLKAPVDGGNHGFPPGYAGSGLCVRCRIRKSFKVRDWEENVLSGQEGV